MMYSKLAFRNIRRSLRDYIIYFVTLTLTAVLMYSFLALGFSPDILAMTENMSAHPSLDITFPGGTLTGGSNQAILRHTSSSA